MDDYEFIRCIDFVLDFLGEFYENANQSDVTPQVNMGYLRGNTPRFVTDDGEKFEDVLEDFKKNVMPGFLYWNHRYNFSCIPSPITYPAILGDMLSVAMGGVGFSWKSCPALTEMEMLMCDWYSSLLQIPKKFKFCDSNFVGGGSFYSSTSEAVYVLTLSVRNNAFKVIKEKTNLAQYELLSKFVIYGSEETSYEYERVCNMEFIIYRSIKTDCHGKMKTTDLRAQMKLDCRKDLIPLMVIATIGTFYTFGIDDIEDICKTAREIYPDIYIHVDGSFGGNAMMLKRYQERMSKGLDEVNSIIVDSSKWAQIPIDTITLWVDDTYKFQETFVINPVYLINEIKGTTDFRHFGISLSRRFKALKVWMTFRYLGKGEVLTYLRTAIAIATEFAKSINASPYFILMFAKFTFVDFILKASKDEDNKQFLDEINKEGHLKLFGMKNAYGRFVLRLTIIQQDLQSIKIDRIVEILEEAARKFLKKNACLKKKQK